MSNKVKAFRLAHAWSQEQLAEMAALSVRTVQRIENGDQPSLETLSALAAVFGVSVTSCPGSRKWGKKRWISASQPRGKRSIPKAASGDRLSPQSSSAYCSISSIAVLRQNLYGHCGWRRFGEDCCWCGDCGSLSSLSRSPAGTNSVYSGCCVNKMPSGVKPDRRLRQFAGVGFPAVADAVYRADKGLFLIQRFQFAAQVFDMAIDGAVGHHAIVIIKMV
ncbi:MAG: DNA-binding protein [Proteobacteria bacterium]|nr:DNA-binding protein [Pseudomonadota bacterium]